MLIFQSIFCEVSQNISKETDSKAGGQEEDIMWTQQASVLFDKTCNNQ